MQCNALYYIVILLYRNYMRVSHFIMVHNLIIIIPQMLTNKIITTTITIKITITVQSKEGKKKKKHLIIFICR